MVMNFFHAWASASMPSKSEGSRKWIFILYLAAWFLTTSILARLRRSCSSSKWILTAAWATAFFRICSSRSLTCWISYSSSWYLSCRCSMNSSCSGIVSNLFSIETWHLLYVTSTLMQYSAHAALVLFTVFLNSSAVLIANITNHNPAINFVDL